MTLPHIQAEGLGSLASYVVFAECELNIAAQGEASVSKIVLSAPFIIDLNPGMRITVDLDGDVIWAGYLLQVNRTYWFDVDSSTTTNLRYDLTLADINLLFAKRVVFKQSDPNHFEGPTYRSATYDDTIIDELVTNWLDLSTDDIDTSTLVERVAIVNPSSGACVPADQAFYPFDGSMQWGEAMNAISQVPAAIWGLLPGAPLYGDVTSPFGRLFYADVDNEDAPYELSDNPTASGVGYHDMTIWEDGSDLVNEAFEWGAGKGTNHLVFDHRIDSGSISDHGLWQEGDLIINIWCQDTIEKVSDSIINGSPSSRRGHKNPVTSVELTTETDGFRVGQKARFINEEFGIDQVLPIRRVQMTFPTPGHTTYALLLSEALDRWGFQNPTLFGALGGGGGGGLPPIITVIPGNEEPAACDPGAMLLLDSFARTESPGGWGVSTAGYTWTPHSNATGLSVSGSAGLLEGDTRTETYILDAGGPWNEDTFRMVMPFTVRDAPNPASFPDPARTTELQIVAGCEEVLIQMAGYEGPPATGTPKSMIKIGDNITYIPVAFWTAGGNYNFVMDVAGTEMSAFVTDGVDTYSVGGSGARVERLNIAMTFFGTGAETNRIAINDIDFTCDSCWVNPVNYIDDFDRAFITNPTNGNLSDVGCTSYGQYPWQGDNLSDAGSPDYSDLDAVLDGGLHAVLAGPTYNSDLGTGISAAGYELSLELPVDASDFRMEFTLTMHQGGAFDHEQTDPDVEASYWWRFQNEVQLYVEINRSRDWYGDLSWAGEPDPVYAYIGDRAGVNESGIDNGCYAYLMEGVPGGSGTLDSGNKTGEGSFASGVGVVLERHDDNVSLIVGGITLSTTITTEPGVLPGEGVMSIRFETDLRNEAASWGPTGASDGSTEYADWAAAHPNSDFYIRISELRVTSDRGSCLEVPGRLTREPYVTAGWNGECV